MRVIKFRACDKSRNIIYRVRSIEFDNQENVENCWTDGPDFSKEYGTISDLILMEYTGLKDKNGVDIYEGDIIEFQTLDGKDNKTLTLPVVWDEFDLRFAANEEGWSKHKFHQHYTEVIGNIFQNPELLETT